jgi:hypothetical protein
MMVMTSMMVDDRPSLDPAAALELEADISSPLKVSLRLHRLGNRYFYILAVT